MPRTFNPTAHAVRRDTFLDAAQRLIQARGYDQMSIQDVLDEVGASRGAFYHYFDSKTALLDAVVERMVIAGLVAVTPIVSDPSLSAPEKLSRLFTGLARWKADRRDLVLALLRVWYSDDNALVRDKLRRRMMVHLVPILTEIVDQGRAEGTFSASLPDAPRIIVLLLQGAQDEAGELFFARQANSIPFEAVETFLSSIADSMERILGAKPGSLTILEPGTLRLWFG